MDKKPSKPNITIKRADQKRFECITTYHLNDKRLTLAEKGFITMLFILPPGWKITKRATSEYFGISEQTFINYIHKFIELGYIEIKKTKNNKATYILRERAIKGDFDPRNIDAYTIKQLNNYLNDQRIEERYKNLIRKALEKAKDASDEFDKLIEELNSQKER